MIKKHFALLAIYLFFIAIITSACGGGGKTTPPSYPFIPVPTPTPTVSPTPIPTPTPEKFPLELSQTEFTLNVGATDNITVTLNGEDVTEQVEYESDDESIATAEKGKITAGNNEGTAKISVSKEGANSATITVNVTDDSEEVTLDDNVLNKLGYKKVKNEENYYDIKTIEDDTLVTNLEIPDIFKDNEGNKYKITGIGQSAFYSCTSLKNVNIPNSVTTIGEKAFTYCPSLEKVTIPNSVTIIGKYAFNTCPSLENVTIGNNVTTIGEAAFAFCYSLENVTIGNSVTTIGEAAFYECDSLKNVTIPNSVTTIGESAFYECGYYQGTAHLTLDIPDSVTTIGNNAFYKVKCISYTQNLNALPYPDDNPNWGALDQIIKN